MTRHDANVDDKLASVFFRQTIGTYATQILAALLSLASSVIIARALGPAGRGDYAVAMALGAIGVQFGNLGLQSSNSYFVAKDRTLLPRLLGNSLATGFLFGGGTALALGLVFQFWSKAPLHGRLLVMGLVWIPFGLVYLFAVNLLMGLQEVRLYNTFELLNRGVSAVFIVTAILLGANTPEDIFLVVLLALLLVSYLTVRSVKKISNDGISYSRDLFRKNFQLGWKAYLCCFFAFLVIRLDLLMVKWLSGAAAAGFYSIAGTIADYVLLLPTAIAAVLFPKLSAISDDRQKRLLARKAVTGTALGLTALLLVLGISANFVITLLFGSAFAPAVSAVLLLTPGILFLGLETVLVQYLNSCGFPGSVVVLWIAATVLNVLANLWAIPRYGINGASVVSSISYLFALIGVAGITYMRRSTSSGVEQQMAAVVGAIRE